MRARLALLVVLPCLAFAQVAAVSPQAREDGPGHVDIAAARALYGSGRSDPALQATIARALEEGLRMERPARATVEALVTYVRVLGGTGDAAHLPLIERAAASPLRPVAREAREARAMLERRVAHGLPYIVPEHVRLVEQAEADGCRYLRTHMCRGGESVDECLVEHRTMVAETGGNAVLVLTRVENVGVAQYDTGSMVAKHYRCPVPGDGRDADAGTPSTPTPAR
ncbi:hypothetical protein [Lysobacter humi (ex Lee et al. 2017)]